MRVIITEQQFKDFLRLSVLGESSIILNENQESKSFDAATKLLMDKLGWAKDKADTFIRINLRNDIPILRDTNHGAKFILGATRLYINGELNNGQSISQLNTVLKYIASDAHINEYDRNLNGKSLQTLVNRFAQNVTDDLEKDKNKISSQTFSSNSQYRIVSIDSFEEATKYGKYTSWCITHDSDMLNSYTNNGIGQFYFILRKGFENEPKEQGENCPLDSYGLSMVAVCVDENGALKTCTCRWNHDNGGNDSIMNTKQISELIGRNFYNVFKANNKWEETLQNAKARLKNGEEPKEIFDNVGFYDDGYAFVKLNNRWNYIDEEGNILSKQWFDYANGFFYGFGIVKLKEKYNFINTQGNILSKQWFDWVEVFDGGFATVELNKKWNWIDTKGNILSKQWFDYTSAFSDGFGAFELNGKWNWIDAKGKILSKQWFDNAKSFYNGFARVELNGKVNFINTDCNYLSKRWFDDALFYFVIDYVEVKLNDKWFMLNKQGKISPGKKKSLNY